MNSQYLSSNNQNQYQGNSLANSSIRYGSNVFISNRASPTKYKLLNSFDFQQSQQELAQKEEVLLQQIQQMQQLNQRFVGENDFLKQKLEDTVKQSEKSGRPLSKQAIHVLTLEQENKQLIQKIKVLRKKEIYQEELIRKIESGDFDEEIHKVAQDNEMKKQHLKYLTHRDLDVKTNLEDLEIGLQNDLIGIKQKINKLKDQNVILEHQHKTYQEISKQIDEERLKKDIEAKIQAEKIQQQLEQQEQIQSKVVKKQVSSYRTVSKKQSQNITHSQASFQNVNSSSDVHQQNQDISQQYFNTADPQQQENIKFPEMSHENEINNQSPQNNNINQNYNIKVFGPGSKETTQMEATPMSQINASGSGFYAQVQNQQGQSNKESNFGKNVQQQRQQGVREEREKEKTIPVTHIQL